jgi:hypothetical protein
MRERLLPFTARFVRCVPRATGTYFLFRGEEPLCAGVAAGAASLRSELEARFRRMRGEERPTHFYWIESGDVLTAYRLQLSAYALWGLRGKRGPPAGCEAHARALRQAARGSRSHRRG